MKVILARYGEIALKGKNRINFENKLKDNIKRSVECSVKKTSGRFVIYPEDTAKAVSKLKKIFGLVSISIAEEVDVDMDKIKEECLNQTRGRKFDTFRISVQRSLKKLRPSPELEKEIGAHIVEKTAKRVKLKNPDLEISVEVSDMAYVFSEKMPCVGGIPAGIEGRVALLIENRESILAGLLAMKRGCDIVPVAIKNINTGMLREYGCHREIINIKKISEIEAIAEKNNCKAIVVGQQLKDIKEIPVSLPVLRPLVGISPEKAGQILRIE